MTNIFEQERLQQLQDELEFATMCIGRMTQDFNYHRSHSGNDFAYKVLEEFKMDQLRLEVQIATLTEFLEE